MKRKKYEKYVCRLFLTVAVPAFLAAACTRPLELGLGAPDSSSDGGDTDNDTDTDTSSDTGTDTGSPDDAGQPDGSVPTDGGVTD